ncbi:MAG: PRC-barrel domain protein [Planctomycetaceae bacterium]|nr:PRC-barrel domain protein [Planctomycetaceae bacterium]
MLLSRKILSLALLFAVATVVSGRVISAQDAAQPNAVPQQNPAAKPAGPPGQSFRPKQIIGSKVNIEGNTAVGTIDDIVIDEHGNVDYLIVAKDDASLVTVPWDAATFNADQQVATVQITSQKFQQVPTYTVKQYPVFTTPAYRAQVYKYYGITPGQDRRMIRRGGAVVVPAQ